MSRYGFAIVVFLWALLTLAPVAECRSPVILFDAGHGERFSPQKQDSLGLTGLAGLFAVQGFDVQSVSEPLSEIILANVDAVVISGPFTPFSPAEIDALESFVKQGGDLAIMLHVAPVVSSLLNRFGVIHSNGVIREAPNLQVGGEPLNFTVVRKSDVLLFANLSHFAVYGCWALAADQDFVRITAASSDKSWVDLNGNHIFDGSDVMQSFGLVAQGKLGQGDYVVFGDDAIFQNRFLVGENRKLGEKLVDFFKY